MAAQQPGSGSSSAPPRVILAVDDDEAVRRVAAENLRRLGFTVIEARDGDEALRILGDASHRIDLLFSDVRMPGPLSGPELAERAVGSQPSLRIRRDARLVPARPGLAHERHHLHLSPAPSPLRIHVQHPRVTPPTPERGGLRCRCQGG